MLAPLDSHRFFSALSRPLLLPAMTADDWTTQLRCGLRRAVDVAVEAARRAPSDAAVFTGRLHPKDTSPLCDSGVRITGKGLAFALQFSACPLLRESGVVVSGKWPRGE